ncbi:MAG: hypothetical protein A3B37_02420 [Candidatus Sungbacteria bacterium RIFCSPLOWO2_01_FULL_59_16]|uniref:Uncharacterized protein n=1 Tax=Candidatus Sungbacteria bacterium RIFCSPLOWO2_01_FULL_59_16 TaxID=1802280 RepID=A0A1G2LCX6_9BACT|nr:MAG: hypothetical protein A3B37_02420 [Candidatus Sungbacteria bacterium RIFCSPLOWO2_01_FULL_59_16]
MRYAPKHYAEAFATTIAKTPAAHWGELIKRFLRAVRKHGDVSRIRQILTAVERRFVTERGGEWIRLEFARPQPERALAILRDHFRARDHVEVVVRPELIAGIRITRNGETELDYSLARKLKKLFRHSLPSQ